MLEDYPTLSIVLSILSSLLTNPMKIRLTDNAALVDFKGCVTKDLNRRFHLDDDSLGKSPLAVSCFLDSRYRPGLFN